MRLLLKIIVLAFIALNVNFYCFLYFRNSPRKGSVSKGRPSQVLLWMQEKAGSEINMSNLGRHLFLEESLVTVDKSQFFRISVWQFGSRLERRLIKRFGSKRIDPFQFCSVQNCYLTYDNSSVIGADAVIVHLHLTKGPKTLPQERTPTQRWIFLTDESPQNTFMATRKFKMKDYNGVFNWSMTYRSDSDIPIPYGRTLPLIRPLDNPLSYNKSKLVAVMGSNCGGTNNRWSYVANLSHYINIDVYGKCGPLKCNGHYNLDCPALNDYKFYLAFENGNCNEYITEKMWWNAYKHGAVPVVMGGPRKHYEVLCPPHSFIHVNDFDSPQQLAEYLLYLEANVEEYRKYFEWTKYFKIVNEHGYFGSDIFHYCRVCEGLNFNDRNPKVYWHLDSFWNVSSDCYGSWQG